jgi:hypothetical protein
MTVAEEHHPETPQQDRMEEEKDGEEQSEDDENEDEDETTDSESEDDEDPGVPEHVRVSQACVPTR